MEHVFVTWGCRTGRVSNICLPTEKGEQKPPVHAIDVDTITQWKENRNMLGKPTLLTQLQPKTQRIFILLFGYYAFLTSTWACILLLINVATA